MRKLRKLLQLISIFVIILTMFLLNKQTEIEQESKKSERVFDEKVKIYQKILDICSDMLMDGNLTQDEINRLPFPLLRLQMLADDTVIETFQKVFNKLNDIYKSDPEAEEVEIQKEEKNEKENMGNKRVRIWDDVVICRFISVSNI